MNENGQIWSNNSNKVLSPFSNKEGRPVVCLLIDGIKKFIRLDYLVISTNDRFYDDIIRLIHVDEIEWNCNISNLIVLRKIDVINKYKDMYKVDNLEDICEEWKTYPDIESIEISNFGAIRNIHTKELLRYNESHGYQMLHINNRYYFIHRLVAELYVENPNPDKYHFINHIDGNKLNNIFWNLEWCNISINTQHAALTGLNNGPNYYRDDVVRNICLLLSQGLKQSEISIITGVNRKYISDIYRGRRRKDISDNYIFNKRIPLRELYNEDAVIALIRSGYKAKDISSLLKINYNQSFVSYYERLKRKIG